MERIEKTIEVECPVRMVYNQWTQFEEFPEFMAGVKEVRQIDDTHVHWHAEVWGKDKEWDAEITEQVPDERISWKSVSGAYTAGTVRFEPVSPDRTRIRLVMAYEPEGPVESVGDALGVLSGRVQNTVEDFKKFIEERGQETGAWRGTVRDSRSQNAPESARLAGGDEGLAPAGTPGAATTGSRGTAGSGGAGYTKPGGSSGEQGHLPGHATNDVPNDAWPFGKDVKKP
jgi:ribosome-associated toxin RatA of RatAB toxin-antitoxin module